MTHLTRTSELTGKVHTMELPITEEELDAGLWDMQEGAFVQEAFPMLDPDQCEFIKSGITAEEWKTLGGDDE